MPIREIEFRDLRLHGRGTVRRLQHERRLHARRPDRATASRCGSPTARAASASGSTSTSTPPWWRRRSVLAKLLIGRDADSREKMYDDCKRECAQRPHGPRQPTRHRALGPRRQALRRARSRSCSAASASGCRPMPAPIHGDRNGGLDTQGGLRRLRRALLRAWATAPSRSTAGTTATRARRPPTCCTCAQGGRRPDGR